MQLSECNDRDKISVSCLDLTYSITYKITKTIKDESKDETNFVALHDIAEEELVHEEEGMENVYFAWLYVIIILEKHDFAKHKRTGFERIRQTFRHVSSTVKLYMPCIEKGLFY